MRRSGCPCRTLYSYEYSVYVQAQALMYTTYATQTVDDKHCTCTRTVCKLKTAGLCTIGASLRLSMPNTVHVHKQCARPSMRVHIQLAHHSNWPCRKLYMYTYSVNITRLHSRVIGEPPKVVHVHVRGTHDTCTAQIAHAEHYPNTRICTTARQVHHSVRKRRTPYTHAYTYSRR